MDTKAAWIIKIVFALLIIFIVVEVILGIRNLKQPITSQLPQNNTLASKSGGKIALVADKAKYKVGENINISARVFTGGHLTDGTDLIISYDPNFIEASSSAISTGSIYNDYPPVSVSKGKIAISGIASTAAFNGLGVLANLTLKAKQTGQTALTIGFTPGSTTDSNITESKTGQDVLDEVTNLNLTIDNTGGSEVAGSCSERVYTECTDSSGKSGTYWCSSIVDGFSCSAGCFKEKTGKELGCKVI